NYLHLDPGWYRLVVEPYDYFIAGLVAEVKTIQGYNTIAGGFQSGGLRIATITTEDQGEVKSFRKYQYEGGQLMAIPLYEDIKTIDKTNWEPFVNPQTGELNYQPFDASVLYKIYNSSSYNPMSASAQG